MSNNTTSRPRNDKQEKHDMHECTQNEAKSLNATYPIINAQNDVMKSRRTGREDMTRVVSLTAVT